MTQLQFKSDANQQPQQQAPQGNPFGQQQPTQQQAPQGNPFGQQPQQQAPQGNPFGQQPAQQAQQQAPQAQQQAPQGNPFGQQAPQGNSFGQQAQQPAQQPAQQQAIQQDVGANPPPTVNQAFAAFGVATGSANPFGQQQQSIQTGGERVDPNQQTSPFGGQQPVQDAQMVQEHETQGWADPNSGRNQANNAGVSASIGDEVPTIPSQAPTGMVPIYTFVPADKLDKVLSAIGRAVK